MPPDWSSCVLSSGRLVNSSPSRVPGSTPNRRITSSLFRQIEDYESKFDKVRNDPPAFAKVAESYRQQAQAWIDEWVTVAPDLSDDEGKAIQAAIAKLNRRATKMLTGTS